MFATEASRERWTLKVAIGALLISGGALFFTYRQWRSSERAVDVADRARKDAVIEAEKQRIDAQNMLALQSALSEDLQISLDGGTTWNVLVATALVAVTPFKTVTPLFSGPLYRFNATGAPTSVDIWAVVN